MATLFLHVGPHKTGSSYLQSEFANQSIVLQKQGVIYPLAGREYLSGHHNLAWYYMGKVLVGISADEIKNKIRDVASDTTKNVLFSSENFLRILPKDLSRMADDFNGFDKIKILYFKRSGNGYAYSLWQEMVKHGSTVSLNKVRIDDVRIYFTYDPFDSEKKISKLEQVLRAETTVFDYNEILLNKTGLLDAVCKELGINLTSSTGLLNASMEMEIIELVRAANIYASLLGKPPSGIPKKVVMAALRRRDSWFFRFYLKYRTSHLKTFFSPGQLFENGFPFTDNSDEQRFTYIEDDKLFDGLNKDNLAVWKKIKSDISTWHMKQ